MVMQETFAITEPHQRHRDQLMEEEEGRSCFCREWHFFPKLLQWTFRNKRNERGFPHGDKLAFGVWPIWREGRIHQVSTNFLYLCSLCFTSPGARISDPYSATPSPGYTTLSPSSFSVTGSGKFRHRITSYLPHQFHQLLTGKPTDSLQDFLQALHVPNLHLFLGNRCTTAPFLGVMMA